MLKQRVRWRRKVRTRRRRQLQVLAVGLAGAGGAWVILGGLGAFTASWFRSASVWRIQGIEIVGATPVTQGALTATLPVTLGDSLWGFSRADVERDLLQRIPSLARVQIQRRWPGRVLLRVQERIPIGWSWKDGTRWAVDAEGILFVPPALEQLSAFPEVGGPTSPEDRRLLARFLMGWNRTQGPLQGELVRCAVNRQGGTLVREISLWLDDGTCVFWGPLQEDRMMELRSRLSDVLTDARRRYLGLEYVDLRYLQAGVGGGMGGRIVVKRREGGLRGST